ncbi:50S ribosomal protein L35 [Candidatus Dojkabacteria bacterium]|uniref:Large ribosomal subunit protein bL35 n=1 Tax=Candidatus Dojkabacteria bacterium TaxID=2099670 RepID=A0A955RIP7_9BACT|nr:50S ribosomal protein L35 [Candidatus Dojkabacteria bacterium]
MPKLKTHKATKKRFKITSSGKVMHWKKGNNGHLRSKKTTKHKQRLSGPDTLSNTTEARKVKKLVN